MKDIKLKSILILLLAIFAAILLIRFLAVQFAPPETSDRRLVSREKRRRIP